MRRTDISRSVVIVLCLLGCNICKALTKALQEDSRAKEVALKVHLSDASTHQPLSGVTVEIFANHTPVAKEISGEDGNIFIRIHYRLGDLLVVTATRRGYVPSSSPWRPARLPVFSSLSLDLLPERTATLMVYDDIVQIVAGYQGSRQQPWVQFPRRALHLPPNTTYTNLTALLTVSHSGQDTQRFPYLQSLPSNGTSSDWFELTPIAAISVHLLGSDGVELHVNEPVSVSVPLPANSGLDENDHVPAWRFDPKLGAWLKISLGNVHRDGAALTLTYIAPQLGYWVAAMSPINTGPVVAKDISTYHTVFLLAILGGMAIILLFLLCLLLYYCRRKCVRSRRTHQKFALSSSLDGSKRDQATSMSHLNLISETRLDHVGAEPDLHTPMLKTGHYDTSTNELLTSQDELQSPQRGDYRRSYSSTISSSPHPLRTSVPPSNPHLLHHAASAGRLSSDSRAGELRLSPAAATPVTPAASPCRDRETILERRPADYLLSRSVDHLERPAALPRPGALLCCTSELQVSQGEATYQKARPTLLIPAHYIRLPGTHPLSGQALLLQSDEQSELESIQAELNASRKPQGEAGQGDGGGGLGEGREGEAGARPAEEWTLQTAALPEALSIPNSLSQAGLGVVQMNGEDQLLAEKTLMELRGGKPLPHPRAWFVSLDGRSNAHIRHSYIDLQRAGHSASSAWSNDASLDSGVDVSDVTPGRRARNLSKGQERARPAAPPAAYTQLVFVEGAKAGRNADAKAGGNADASGPEDGSLGCLLTSAVREEAEEESLTPPSPPGPSVKGDGVQRGGQDQTLRTERAQTGPPLSPSDGGQGDMAPPDDSGEDENKKSPWQKREERPLLAFNLK
uniref:Family with sequence similarity 171 member A1 n=1 Tax=Electrophorus electricus TaxID=8005 RepID=A0AAY5EBQ0_ELEEL